MPSVISFKFPSCIEFIEPKEQGKIQKEFKEVVDFCKNKKCSEFKTCLQDNFSYAKQGGHLVVFTNTDYNPKQLAPAVSNAKSFSVHADGVC